MEEFFGSGGSSKGVSPNRLYVDYDEYLSKINNPIDPERMQDEQIELLEEIQKIQGKSSNVMQSQILNGFEDKFEQDSYYSNNITEFVPEKLRPPLPTLPSNPIVDSQKQYFEYTHLWSAISASNLVVQILQNLGQIQAELLEIYGYQLEELERQGYPSIMAYWNLLPDEIRNKPTVAAYAVVLDKYGYLIPLERKQQLLNQAAYYTLPLDKSTDTFLRGVHRSQFKFYPRASDAVHLDMIDDDGESINSLKRQKLEALTEEDEFDVPEHDMDPY